MGMGIRRVSGAIRRKLLTSFHKRYQLNHGGRGSINFIDVGSVGSLPDPWFGNQNHISFLLNFEPNELSRRTANSLTLDTALWDTDEERPFYVYKGLRSSGSSLFEQNFDYVKENFDTLRLRGSPELANTWLERSSLLKATTLKCRNLDSVIQENTPKTPFHFMKIDAQGAEFNILKGSVELLKTHCIGLHLELFSFPLYKGIVLLPEVEAFLAQFGFTLEKKFPAHGSFDSQNDCLFLRLNGDAARLSTIKEVYSI